MPTTVVSAADLAETLIRRKVVTVHNAGAMTSWVECGELGTFILDEPTAHGGAGKGPSPLQGVLGCLCGCEAATFNRTAAEHDFSYTGIDFDAAYTIDIRGRMGVRSVVPHFQTVRVQATVYTDESEARLRGVVEETEARCPVFNLINDAGVKLEMLWVRQSGGERADSDAP